MERNKETNHLKAFSVLIAILISVVSWVYVVYNYDPMTIVTYSNVPISFVGEDVLADKGYAVSETSTDSIYVELSQRRIDSVNIDADDIKVVADVSEAVEGKNGIGLSIMGPDGTQIVDSEVRTVSVDVEPAERKEVRIDVEYLDTSDATVEPVITNLTSTKATVIGAESTIKSVSKAVATIGYSDTASGRGVYTRALTAVDNDGDLLPHMVIYPGTVNFTAEHGMVKPVILNIKVTDESNDNYQRTVDGPEMITIKGTAEAIENITSIDTEEINVSYLYEDTDIDLSYVLPEGVYIANDSKDQTAHITVTETKSRKDSDTSQSESDNEG